MSFMKSYLSVLNEDTKKNSSVAVDNTGELEGAEKAKKFAKDSGPEAVDGVEAPVKGPHSEQDADALPKAVSSESRNPFDLLYNKILSEEAFEDMPNEMGDTLNFEGEIEDNAGDSLDFDVSEDEEEEGEEHEEEEAQGLESVLDHLKNAVSALEAMLSEEEGEEEESLDMDMDMDSEEVPMKEEAVEAEIEGHALVDQEKLEKGMTKHSNQQVRGAVPVSKKKAEVVKGKKVNGKPEPFNVNPETLTSKNNNVGGVTVGKSLFDQ